MRVSMKVAAVKVANCLPFRSSSCFAENTNNAYVVYSYGYNTPILMYAKGVWYENLDKFSVTTTKHLTQLRPIPRPCSLTTAEIRSFLESA